jgi:hypothetical protein
MNRFSLIIFASSFLCASHADAQPQPTPAASATALPPQPITARLPVVFEPPHKLDARPSLRDKARADEERIVLSRWNEGGRSAPWHPAPRVIVDNPRVTGPIRPATVLRTARAKGYWLIRSCYDAALAENQDLGGKLSVGFTIRKSGALVRPAIAGKPTLPDAKVVQCIRLSMRKISFPRPRSDARVTLDIQINPGDAPVPLSRDDTPGPGSIDTPLVQGTLAAGAGAAVQQCYVDGVRRMPGLWGRMLLLADVAYDGTLRGLTEVGSTFPDPQTTRCVSEAVRAVALPAPNGGELRIVVPIRFGSSAR